MRLPPCPVRTGALGLCLLSGAARLWAQDRCPDSAGTRVEAGWRAYRADSITAAGAAFAAAEAACPGHLGARVGLGYVALRQGRLPDADSLFTGVVARDSLDVDAWNGLALVANRRGDTHRAGLALRRVLRLHPDDRPARDLLDRLEPGWDRPPPEARPRPARLEVPARTRASRFQVPRGTQWADFYIRGVNIGAALPGRFPSEFPQDSALYARWLTQIAEMHANLVRLYTILPPAFYRALAGHNRRHPNQPLRLIQGVWTELPPDDDFDHPGWKEEFRREMRRAVDVVHGAAAIPVRPGHAGGRYDADVSRWTLAWIIGREWEPYAVVAWDDTHPGRRPWRGRFLTTDSAPAMDRWLAEQSDYLLGYEVDRYNTIRPIAYTNWPTLDPLTHPTEATTAEEQAWRRRMGRPADMLREYENDAIGLDASLIRPTRDNPAGWFASYHAYPYYPDFMLYDREYNQARSPEGRSSYFGYLTALKRHHRNIPLVIAEYGVPSSRGMAHLQPQGWTHGGHDERAMARIDARLTREIRASGAAGGILFAWIDEWFKKNWVVVDLEIPSERTRLWHNLMDAEQNYGVVAMLAGREEKTPELGGAPGRWLAGDTMAASTGPARAMVVRSDASYVYLAVALPQLAGRPFPWDSLRVILGFDTWLPGVGQHRLDAAGPAHEVGFEFRLRLEGPAEGRLEVTPEYNPYGGPPDSTGDDLGRFYHRPVTIRDRSDGRFDSLYVTINRARFGRDGTFFPARGYDRGRLRYGTESGSTLSDWYFDSRAGLLEIRLPWMLLNVSDPSSRTLLYETQSGPEFGTVKAEGWRIGLWIEPRRGGAGLMLPVPSNGGAWRIEDFIPWQWPTWEVPQYHERMKPVYHTLRELWAGWTDDPGAGSR